MSLRHTIRTVVLVFVAWSLAPNAWAQSASDGDPGLQRLVTELGRLAEASGGTVGVGAYHIESGRSAWLNGGDAFPMASTYKVPIAVQLLTRVDRGEISLTDMIDLEPSDIHPGSGTISALFDDPGVSLSVLNLLELMLLISDNSATDLCLRVAGGPDAVNARMAELGVTGLNVARPTSLLISDFYGVEAPADGRISLDEYRERAQRVSASDRMAAQEAFATDPRDTSTPEAMVTLLKSVWHGEALSEESTELFNDIMLRVQTGTGRIKGILPRGTDVGHKTGTIGGTTNDVGYIYLPGDAGHVITTVFVKDSDRPVPEREATIAQVSRAIYDYFLFNPGSTEVAANPRFGRWQLQSDAPPPAINIMTYEPYGAGGMSVTVESTNSEGRDSKWGYVTMFDGAFRPVDGQEGSDTAVEIVDDRTNKIINRRNGRVTQIIINVLSRDGNRIENEYRRITEDGTERVSHAVYERIP